MRKMYFALFLAAVLLFSACGAKNPPETTSPDEIIEVPAFTEGLVYAPNPYGDVEIVGYVGSDTDVIIPAELEGLPVVAIANSAFAGNTKITSVTLGANIKIIKAAAFVGCENLTSANLNDSLTDIGSAAFFGCTKLKNVTLPSALKQVGLDAFGNCHSVEALDYNGNQSMWSRVSVALGNGVFDTKLVLAEGGAVVKLIDKGECNANISWRLGYDGVLHVTGNGHIPDYKFDKVPWGAYSDSITKIVVEDGIDVIGKNAFLGCYNAESAEIASTVRLIDNNAFYGCKLLSEITLPENLRRIGESAFFGCESIKTLQIPDTVTAIGSGAFMGCTEIAEIKMSSSVTKIEKWSFANCYMLKSIDLTSVESIGTNAFFDCNNLAVVKVSEKLSEIGNNAFLSCPQVFLNGNIAPNATIGSGNTRIK